MADLSFILANARWPALLVDESGRIRQANDAAVESFGAVVRGESPLLTSIWSPQNEATAQQFQARLSRSPIPYTTLKMLVKGGASQGFKTYLTPVSIEGHRHDVFQFFPNVPESPAAPLPNTPGATGATGADKGKEASLAQQQKLECAMQMIRSVVLDFNNVLTSILGHTSLMLGKSEANHPWRHSLLEVEKSAEKAAEIVHDLASFSRPDKDPRSLAAGNLNQVLRRTVEVFQSPGNVHVEWNLALENKLYAAHFDEAKMQQAFLKILENAIQAVDLKAAITVATRNVELTAPMLDGTASLAPGCYVCVEIIDNGCGIKPEVLPRVFEPFFTTKANHRGLGLAWVYGIVTNHGGSVTIHSSPSQGTLVRIYLPALKRIVHDQEISVSELGGTQTILVVDDEILLLTMAQTILSSFGYKVHVAPGGDEALDFMAKSGADIDLVITDLVMPRMSGREFIDRLRRLKPQIRILCCSGYVRPVDDRENEAYLQKPFTCQQLLRKVKQVLS